MLTVLSPAKRLDYLYRAISEVVRDQAPDATVVEQVFGGLVISMHVTVLSGWIQRQRQAVHRCPIGGRSTSVSKTG